MKKKEYDKPEKKKVLRWKKRIDKAKETIDGVRPYKPPKPKDPLELQLWKLNTRLGALQKEFRNHIEENK